MRAHAESLHEFDLDRCIKLENELRESLGKTVKLENELKESLGKVENELRELIEKIEKRKVRLVLSYNESIMLMCCFDD